MFYDFTKGGTDIIGQKTSSYTVNPRSFMWALVELSYLPDPVRVNENTTYNLIKHRQTVQRRDLGVSLTEALLITLHMKRKSMIGLNKSILQKKILFTVNTTEISPVHSNQSKSRRQCRFCLEEIRGHDHNEKSAV